MDINGVPVRYAPALTESTRLADEPVTTKEGLTDRGRARTFIPRRLR
jgi:hypothetical protein